MPSTILVFRTTESLYDTNVLLWFFFKGLLVGFLMAFPLGPMGMLCIRRSLVYGRQMGRVTGLGIATGDALYGAVAAFGLTAVSSILIAQQRPIEFVGGFFLLCLGIKFMTSIPAKNLPSINGATSSLSTFASTLTLTLTNATTILSFIAIFVALGLANRSTDAWTAAGLMVFGIFCGSFAWWFILSETAYRMRSRFSPQSLRLANILSGIIIFGFGIAAMTKGAL